MTSSKSLVRFDFLESGNVHSPYDTHYIVRIQTTRYYGKSLDMPHDSDIRHCPRQLGPTPLRNTESYIVT